MKILNNMLQYQSDTVQNSLTLFEWIRKVTI